MRGGGRRDGDRCSMWVFLEEIQVVVREMCGAL
jgi:hypothetical protein